MFVAMQRIVMVFGLLVSLLASGFAGAVYISSASLDGVEYFLFSNPDRIDRFHTASGAFLPSIQLAAESSVFAADGSKVFVAHDRAVHAYDPATGTVALIREMSAHVKALMVAGEFLVILETGDMATVLRRDSYGQVYNGRLYFYSGVAYHPVPGSRNAYFQQAGVSSASIHRLSLNAEGVPSLDFGRSYRFVEPFGSDIFSVDGGSRIIDAIGQVYDAELIYKGALGGDVDALADIDGGFIVARDNTLLRFDDALSLRDSLVIAEKPTRIAVNGDAVYLFAAHDSDVAVQQVSRNDFSAPYVHVPAPDPVTAGVVPARMVADNTDRRLFVLDTQASAIQIWSMQNESWLTGFGLARIPTSMTYAALNKRLYLGYSDGVITYFDTAAAEPVEEYFLALESAVSSLVAIDGWLVAVDASGQYGHYYSYSHAGVLTSRQDWYHPSTDFLWDARQQRIFHFRDGSSPNDILWDRFSVVSGELLYGGDSPYHNDIYAVHPMRLSGDGSYLLMGSGFIHDSTTLEKVNALPNGMFDAAWLADEFYTVYRNGGRLVLQGWSNNFEKKYEMPLSGNGMAWLFADAGRLVVVERANGNMSVRVVLPADFLRVSNDTDADGIADVDDNCPLLANADQYNMDQDRMGDPCDDDADGDRMPDLVEVALGLNPVSALDAMLDYDGDGASNAYEFLSGHDLANAASRPAWQRDFTQSFENIGWQGNQWFAVRSQTDPLRYAGHAHDGNYSLQFSADARGYTSEVELMGLFPAGELSFSVDLTSFDYYGHTFQVLVDGVEVSKIFHPYSGPSSNIHLTAGEHSIRFIYRRESNSTVGVAAAFLDKVAFVGEDMDPDGDLLLVTDDNCPLISNKAQQDFDGDRLGDVCDADDDGDGVDDSVEDIYFALDPLDPEDVRADTDGDGVENGTEVSLGNSPDLYDDYPVVATLNFLALNNHRANYNSNGFDFTDDWHSLGNNLWERTRFNDSDVYELRDDGLYLLRQTRLTDITTMTQYEFSGGLLYLPANMQVHKRYVQTATVNVRRNGVPVGSYEMKASLQLTAQDFHVYAGEDLSSFNLERAQEILTGPGAGSVGGEYNRYAETIGLYEAGDDSGSMYLVSVDDGSLIAAAAASSGGALSPFWILILTAGLRRRALRKAQAVPAS